jgi:septum site-determining protein MinC
MTAETITIKGIREGLLVTLPTTSSTWPNALAQLEARLSASPAFFKGARMGLIVGARGLGEDDIRAARDLLLRHDVTLWALIADNPATQDVAAHLGLDNKLPPREPRVERSQPVSASTPAEPAPTSEHPATQAATEVSDAGMVVRRTLRSGVSLRHPGSIVVIGDVHSGAEIIAGGDVVVWGKLHGTVHAGAFGDNEAVVCALDLAPTQLRIGRYITRSPDERRRKAQPETGRVKGGRIEVVAWNPKSNDR